MKGKKEKEFEIEKRYHEKKRQIKSNIEFKPENSSEETISVSCEKLLETRVNKDVNNSKTKIGVKRQRRQGCDYTFDDPIENKKRKVNCSARKSVQRDRNYEKNKKRVQRAKIYSDPNLHAKCLNQQKKINKKRKIKRKN